MSMFEISKRKSLYKLKSPKIKTIDFSFSAKMINFFFQSLNYKNHPSFNFSSDFRKDFLQMKKFQEDFLPEFFKNWILILDEVKKLFSSQNKNKAWKKFFFFDSKNLKDFYLYFWARFSQSPLFSFLSKNYLNFLRVFVSL